MNAVIDASVERPMRVADASRSGRAAAAEVPDTALRLLGAASATLVALHLILALVFVPQWPSGLASVAWSAVGVPVTMVLLAIAMWLTGAAHRVLLALWATCSTAMAVLSAVGAALGDREGGEGLEMGLTLAAVGAGYLVALDVLARGRWRGPLRVLPIAAASWGPVVLVVVLTLGEGAGWWAFILHLCGGLLLTAAALALSPASARTRTAEVVR